MCIYGNRITSMEPELHFANFIITEYKIEISATVMGLQTSKHTWKNSDLSKSRAKQFQ